MSSIERDPAACCGSAKHARQLLILLEETERAIHVDPAIASACLQQAITLLAAGRPGASPQPRHRGGLARWQVARIDSFIKTRLDHCIRTSELASLLDLSVSHFTHAFKRTTGVTPLTYVAAARVAAARQYMLGSAGPLSEIALKHGFCDQSHFCRVFRRETGLAPQAWRKLHASTVRLQSGIPAASLSADVQARL